MPRPLNSPRSAPPSVSVAEGIPGQGGLGHTFGSLRNPYYRWLWIGMLFSFTSMQMQQLARGYLAFELEGTATALGVVSIGWGAPLLVFSLIGGAIADRSEKRNLLLVTQSAMGVLALIAAILVHTGAIQIWHLVLLGFGQGTVFSFNMPARQSLIPELVAEGELMNAVALNNAAMNMTRIVGPSLAGALIAVPFVGMTGSFYLTAALYLVVVLTLLRIPPTGVAAGRQHRPVVEEMGEGLRYIGSHGYLLTLMGLALVPTVLGMPYQMLLPAFAGDVLHVGSVGLGVMGAAAGAGAVAGALGVASMSNSTRRSEVQLAAGVGFGVALLFFGASGLFGVSLVALVLVGMMSTAYMAINNALLLSSSQPEFHGRVMSVYMLTWSLMPLAALPMSMAGDAVGVQPTVATAGAIIALFVLAVAVFYPAYRRAGTAAGAGDGASS